MLEYILWRAGFLGVTGGGGGGGGGSSVYEATHTKLKIAKGPLGREGRGAYLMGRQQMAKSSFQRLRRHWSNQTQARPSLVTFGN